MIPFLDARGNLRVWSRGAAVPRNGRPLADAWAPRGTTAACGGTEEHWGGAGEYAGTEQSGTSWPFCKKNPAKAYLFPTSFAQAPTLHKHRERYQGLHSTFCLFSFHFSWWVNTEAHALDRNMPQNRLRKGWCSKQLPTKLLAFQLGLACSHHPPFEPSFFLSPWGAPWMTNCGSGNRKWGPFNGGYPPHSLTPPRVI